MTEFANVLQARLREIFPAGLLDYQQLCGQLVITVSADCLLAMCLFLRDEPTFLFAQLMDLCGVDYVAYGQADWATRKTTQTGFSRAVKRTSIAAIDSDAKRFAVAYQLLSITHNKRVRVICYAPGEPPRLPSVMDVWAAANWYEREAFDMFGILFDGHSDLRRLLTDYGFIGHPLRKDFPLQGRVEVRFDPEQRRVIYQPVTIENRVLVPRVIRDDDSHLNPIQPNHKNA